MIFGFSLWAVLAAAIAAWLVGAVWYMALARPWMAALGKACADPAERSGKPSPVPFIISFLAEVLMAIVLAGLMSRLFPGGPSLSDGLTVGFSVWLGFVLTTMTVNHRFGGMKIGLTLIDSGHWLAVLLVQAIILSAIG